MLFNFYPHPSLYIHMTLLKVVSYWQMWQRFSNKSWAKAVAPSAPDMILDNWISLAVHMLSWHHEKKNKPGPSMFWCQYNGPTVITVPLYIH